MGAANNSTTGQLGGLFSFPGTVIKLADIDSTIVNDFPIGLFFGIQGQNPSRHQRSDYRGGMDRFFFQSYLHQVIGKLFDIRTRHYLDVIF